MTTSLPLTGAGRRPQLQAFLDALQAGFSAAPGKAVEQKRFVETLYLRLAAAGAAGGTAPAELPVCEHLGQALATVRSSSPAGAAIAPILEALAGSLTWKTRATGGPQASANWWDGHANAVIIGKGGLEERDDVAAGLSLLAPQVRYPDHTHPPEELYLVLTPGRFQHGDDAWLDLAPGATFHNPPAIRHSMASGEGPLLAIWTMIIG